MPPESVSDSLNTEFLTRFAGALTPVVPRGAMTESAFPGAAQPEAIIIVDEFKRPALIVRNSTYEEPQSQTWKQILNPKRTALERAIRSVGRLELENHPTFPWVGTAWMISENLALTNRHVAMEFARKQGKSFVFSSSPLGKIKARVDFKEEHGLSASREIVVEKVLFIADTGDNAPDMAVIQLSKNGGLPDPIEFFDGKPKVGQTVVTIGYPANDPRNPAPAISKIFGNVFEVKRFAPGAVSGKTTGFTFTHDCSTLGGNSGSVVLDIETCKAVGLHFGGSFRQANFAVDVAKLKQVIKSLKIKVAVPSSFAPPEPKIKVEKPPLSSYTGEGFKEDFLGRSFKVPVPKPKPTLAKLLAPVKGATDSLLRYTHFSIAMHKERRFAIYTAVNIDGANSLSIKRGTDKWFLDPRIAADHQVGEPLYKNNDLDRGHLVRRLDPVWGDKEVATKANDDTFHFTNSTPQHAQFNQKTWNDLEDHILDNAGVHDLKVSVFTGPVFADDDPEYRGVQLPQQYWKVVAMVKSGNPRSLSATAYILSQKDLLTNLEFVFGQFRTYQLPVKQIESLTGLNFGKLRDSDPLNDQESFAIREITHPEQAIL